MPVNGCLVLFPGGISSTRQCHDLRLVCLGGCMQFGDFIGAGGLGLRQRRFRRLKFGGVFLCLINICLQMAFRAPQLGDRVGTFRRRCLQRGNAGVEFCLFGFRAGGKVGRVPLFGLHQAETLRHVLARALEAVLEQRPDAEPPKEVADQRPEQER